MKDYMLTELELIEENLKSALNTALMWQQRIMATDGDTDLNRKLSSYLIPNLNHWLNGIQAGNIKDLEDYFKRLDNKTKGK